jgi:hypothetical protein
VENIIREALTAAETGVDAELTPNSSRNTLALPQPKALDFAGLGLRQRLDKFHRARIFERRDGRLDVIL